MAITGIAFVYCCHMKQSFTITVGTEIYNVTQIQDGKERRYQIETGCNYLFTIHETESGEWMIDDKDVVAINEFLPFAIGHVINEHEKLVI